MAKALEAKGSAVLREYRDRQPLRGQRRLRGHQGCIFPGEYGQVGSYVTGVKMVLPSGDLLEVTEDSNPQLMQILRSSYGLLGIVYEVTYKVKPLTPMHVHHTTYSLKDFISALPDLKALGYSMMFYMFPFVDKITVEFRKYNPGATGEPNHFAWQSRNETWGTVGPKLGFHIEESCSIPAVRYGMIDALNAAWRSQLETIVAAITPFRPTRSSIIRRFRMTAATHSACSRFPKMTIPRPLPTSTSSAKTTTRRRVIVPTCSMSATALPRITSRCFPIPTMAP